MEDTISAAMQHQTGSGPGVTPDDPLLAAANVHRASGRLDKAETSLRKFLKSHPRNAKGLHALGLIASDRGRFDRATQLLGKAVAEAPAAPDILCDLALAQKAAGHHDDAVATHTQVTELLPNSAHAWSNLGTALSAMQCFDEALAAFEKALALEPDNADLHYNLGNTRLSTGRFEDAEAAFVRALDLSPGHSGALVNLAGALKEQGRLSEAENLLRSACALHPKNADLRWNHALALLMSGAYRDGWAAYEARRALPNFAIKPQTIPSWDGSKLAGRRLLVHAEQGFGDSIQFSRYLERLGDQDGEIVFQVPTRLLPLLRTLNTGIELTDSPKAAARCHVAAPLMSLPHLLESDAPYWPGEKAYLSADPDRVALWRRRLAGHDGVKVAIAWQGDPDYRADRTRSIPLAAFAPLVDIPGIRIISLQRGPGCEQLDALPWRDRILSLGDDIDQAGAFLDSAAILSDVDVMITSDTALAHVAGALGTTTWLALSKVPDWRWGSDGETCGWYPSLRLFRQETPGNWGSVFSNIATSLKEKLA